MKKRKPIFLPCITLMFAVFITLGEHKTAYCAAGDLDTSFGTNGEAVISFSPAIGQFVVSAATDSSNRILLAGSSVGSSVDVFLARMNTDGSLDTTFGDDYSSDGISDGYFIYDFGSYETAQKVLVDSQDRIYLIGYTDSFVGIQQQLVMRLNADGTLDTSYAIGAIMPGVLNGCDYGFMHDGALDPNENLFPVGDYNYPGQLGMALFLGLDPNGNGLAGGGSCTPLTPSFGVEVDEGIAIVLQKADSKPLVMGETGRNLFVARYLAATQTLDTTFNGTGISIIFPGTINPALSSLTGWDLAAARKPNGPHYDKAVIVGSTGDDFLVVRLTTSGALDTTFRSTGFGEIDFGNTGERATAVEIDSNGRIIVAGESGGGLGLVRIKKNGRADTTFGPSSNGKVLITSPALEFVEDVLVSHNAAKILVVGNRGNVPGVGNETVVFRFLGN